ncbi:MAG: HAD-IC family P-type ATPase [Candidatus Moranbacteria bacterium]|nr:HAD-IC family P-type ATPase [Candidatus Moranbacteria bacterium]
MEWKHFAGEDGKNVLAELGSSRDGLASSEVKKRLIEYRENQIRPGSSALWKTLRQRLSSSFLYLLLAASALSFFLGDVVESLLILLFIAINISLETYQEYHSAKALRLLKRYLVVHTRVRRGGKIVKIESNHIVPGDIVLVEAGDRLPADVRFLHANGLRLDESVLTGESLVVPKTADLLRVPPVEMHEAMNVGFAGTVVTSGWGEGVAFATGKETAFGDIATLTEETERETVFEKGIRQFSRFILKLVLFTLAIIYVANIFIRGGETSSIELLIFSLALAVSVVPEALPVILTVALSRGSLRLAEKKVVVKRLSAIEDLGSIEVLCCDKTGTLTENLLAVTRVRATDERQCLKLAFASCLAIPDDRGKLHDPFDLALWQTLGDAERQEIQRGKRIDTIPFDPERRRNSVLFETTRGKEVIVRGAPEEILRRSKDVDVFTTKRMMEWVAEAGRQGERVLAVAYKPFPQNKKFSLYEEQELQFIGLIAFSDGLKKTANETIQKARQLGIAVKIITGDSREVAGAVGHAVGLIKQPEDVVIGKELEEMDESLRREAILGGAVFARVSPRQKYEIIQILQEKYEVGFLGEGINDAPALKLANVAIVVESASDIAREASDVVLLEHSLDTVIDGIKEGRTIFANILKYLKITLTSNFGNFYSVALASLFLPFVPLLPIQILLLNLLSDFPMIAIATDTVDPEELEKPRNYQVHSVVLMATMFGVVSSVFDFILFGALYRVSPETLQTAWFLLSVLTEVILIFSLRTRLTFFKAKRASWVLTTLSLGALVVAFALPFIPFVTHAMKFVRPEPGLLLFVGVLAVGYFFATEAVKGFYNSHIRDDYQPSKKMA